MRISDWSSDVCSSDLEPCSEAWAESQVALSRLVSAETALRNVGIDIGAIMAELAQARISGVDTAALEAEAAALQEQVAALAGGVVAAGLRLGLHAPQVRTDDGMGDHQEIGRAHV